VYTKRCEHNAVKNLFALDDSGAVAVTAVAAINAAVSAAAAAVNGVKGRV